MTGAESSLTHLLVAWATANVEAMLLAALALPLLTTLVVVAAKRAFGSAAPEPPPAELPADLEETVPRLGLDDSERARLVDAVPEQSAAETAPPTPAPVEPAPLAPPDTAAKPEPEAALPPPEPPGEEAPAAPARVPLRQRLARTQQEFIGRIGGLLGGRAVDEALLEELEALLFTADLGVKTAQDLLERVRSEATGRDADAVRQVLHDAIREKLAKVEPGDPVFPLGPPPHVILVLGVNGSGKTTTIGKLAARFAREGKHVVLGAGDTFRAAAIEQLQVWGERVGCEVVAGRAGGDPASVAYDTVKAAVARGADVAIIDTAGRLQTKKPLMEELSKISRVIGRDVEGAPHESLLVLDSNTGQNAISQARLFAEAADVTGLVLTKLDGTAKGGVIVGLADELGLPVKLVGVGEGIDDLRDFRADEFVDALFEPAEAS